MVSEFTKAIRPPDLKCPHCGEDRQIERLSLVRWFCQCCSKEWTAA